MRVIKFLSSILYDILKTLLIAVGGLIIIIIVSIIFGIIISIIPCLVAWLTQSIWLFLISYVVEITILEFWGKWTKELVVIKYFKDKWNKTKSENY